MNLNDTLLNYIFILQVTFRKSGDQPQIYTHISHDEVYTSQSVTKPI